MSVVKQSQSDSTMLTSAHRTSALDPNRSHSRKESVMSAMKFQQKLLQQAEHPLTAKLTCREIQSKQFTTELQVVVPDTNDRLRQQIDAGSILRQRLGHHVVQHLL